VKKEGYTNGQLADIAYTLQTGREGMEERIGFTSATIDELCEKLRACIEGNEENLDIFKGNINPNREMSSLLKSDNDIQNAIENWISKGKYDKLLSMWVKGLEVNWSNLYE
jgi:acyl transferase domain-containing protein